MASRKFYVFKADSVSHEIEYQSARDTKARQVSRSGGEDVQQGQPSEQGHLKTGLGNSPASRFVAQVQTMHRR
jgi:hypothetical protein